MKKIVSLLLILFFSVPILAKEPLKRAPRRSQKTSSGRERSQMQKQSQPQKIGITYCDIK